MVTSCRGQASDPCNFGWTRKDLDMPATKCHIRRRQAIHDRDHREACFGGQFGHWRYVAGDQLPALSIIPEDCRILFTTVH